MAQKCQMNVEQQEEEMNELRRKFDTLRAYTDINCVRLKFMHDFFQTISTTMKNAIPKLTQLSEVEAKKAVTKNNPQAIFETTFLENLLKVGDIQNIIANEFQLTSQFIDSTLLELFTNLINKQNAVLANTQKNVHAARKKRDERVEQYNKEYKNCEKLQQEAIKLYQRVQETKNAGAEDKKLVEKLSSACENYSSAVFLLENATNKLNVAHLDFNNATNDAMKELKDAENTRGEELRTIFATFIDHYSQVAKIIEATLAQIDKLDWNWEDKFIKFIDSTRISRGSISPIQFTPVQFSFQDEDIVQLHPRFEQIDMDLPITAAVLTKDCSSSQEYMMQGKKGQIVFIYELPKHKFTYCVSQDGKSKGYIPSDALEVGTVKTAIVNQQQLLMPGAEVETLPCYAGEVLIIVEKKEDGAICKNMAGRVGFVPKNILLYEDEKAI